MLFLQSLIEMRLPTNPVQECYTKLLSIQLKRLENLFDATLMSMQGD